MRRFILVFFLLTSYSVFPQTNLNSAYLMNPDKMYGYVDSCAAFWLNAYDPVHGGFYTNIDRSGNVITSWGTNKKTLSQTRDAYGFIRAFQLLGDSLYLNMAREALDFMYQRAWDNQYGGWYSDVDESGNPINQLGNKSAFDQHYALLGIAAMMEATQDSMDWQWLLNGYGNNESKLWDSRAQYFGYYDYGNYSWSNVTRKSFNATVDAITTHLMSLYLLTNDPIYETRLLGVADNILNHLVASMDSQAIGFVEEYDSDWNWDNSETMTIMGHVLKSAWCLGRIYQIEPDTLFTWGATKLIDDVWQNGYDHEYGGPYKDYDRTSGEMLMWGNPDTAKAWWQMEQAVTSGLQMYYITGDSLYLQMADETLDFFMKYFVDHTYGEVYENRERSGPLTWGDHKGSESKAGYHSIELGYYVYLYGKLFVNKEPATLHYYFKPQNQNRNILLNPLALPEKHLRIKNVQLDGVLYSDYDPDNRILNLPAGTGGYFQVEYELITNPTIAQTNQYRLPESFKLFQNYPNPFNPTTAIRYQLKVSSKVELSIYNLLGQQIGELVNSSEPAGSYEVEWNGRDEAGKTVASGVYIYRIKAGKEQQSRRMILLR
jgi:mannose/cellobiose epimerase-like protein (N-acyl-D-glucosamine 2-epimerase family)